MQFFWFFDSLRGLEVLETFKKEKNRCRQSFWEEWTIFFPGAQIDTEKVKNSKSFLFLSFFMQFVINFQVFLV